MADQIEAVQGLLERLLPDHAAMFRLSILSEAPHESAALFEVSVDPTGTVHVQGTSGVGMPSCLLCTILLAYLVFQTNSCAYHYHRH